MRVLFFTDHYWPRIGGIELRARAFTREMQRRGHVFRVLTSLDPRSDQATQEIVDGVEVLRLPLPTAISVGDLAGVAQMRREYVALAREFSPDLIHSFFSGPFAMLALERPSGEEIPLLLSFTTWPGIHAGPETLLGRLLAKSAWTTANSNRLLATLRDLEPQIEPKSSTVYSGNIWPEIEPASLPFNPPLLLCIGRVVEQKGFDLAISAMSELAARFPTLRLRIAGSGMAIGDLKSLVDALGLAERVEFLGWIAPEAIHELINDATLVLIPSRQDEPFATVAIQAAQMARPVIATDSGGMAEAVLDGKTGILVPKEKVGALAAATAELLTNPEHATRLGLQARERARSVHSWNTYLDAFDAIYRRIAEPPRALWVDAR